MNLQQLIKKFNDYKSAAGLELENATKALNDGDMDVYNAAKAKVDEYKTKMTALKEQIDNIKTIDGLSVDLEEETEKETPVPTKAQRIPFEEEDKEEVDSTDSVAKSVSVLRYGDTPEALTVIMKDIYGPSYMEKRESQKAAFSKYMRYGDSRMKASDLKLLDELILTPESIAYDVKSGLGVSDIKANKTVQQESSLELGGWLVPEDWRADLIKRLQGFTAVRGRARQITTTRDTVEWPRLQGGDDNYTSGVRVTWVDEVPSSATVAQTNFELGSVQIPVHTVMARLDVSRNLLEDSAIDVPMLVSELFAEAMALDEDTKFLTGTGGGSPRGVLSGRDGEAYTPATGIDYAASGAAATLTADGLIDLVYELAAQYLQGSVMIGAKSTFNAIRKLKDGSGDYLWMRGIERGAPPTVLGYDYLMNEFLQSVAAERYPLIFGDLAGYMIVDRVGMTVERVTDTDTTGKNKVAIFGRRRLGGDVIEPWRITTQKVATS